MAQVYFAPAAALDCFVVQGTYNSANFYFTNPDGTPVDLTGFTFKMNVYNQAALGNPVLFTIVPTFVGSPTLGVLNIIISSANAANSGTFSHDLSGDNGSDEPRVFAAGQFIIRASSNALA